MKLQGYIIQMTENPKNETTWAVLVPLGSMESTENWTHRFYLKLFEQLIHKGKLLNTPNLH